VIGRGSVVLPIKCNARTERVVNRIIVVGCGGFGRETICALIASAEKGDAELDEIAVLDDAPSRVNLARLAALDVRWLGAFQDAHRWVDEYSFVIGVGSPAIRAGLVDRLAALGARFETVIDPSARIAESSTLGEGSVVCAGAVISTNVRIGRHVHINPNATVGHDTVLADNVSINPAATISGEVTAGERVLVGAGAVVLQGLTLGSDALVGAAACVTRSVRRGVTVLGVPAHEME